MDDQYPLLSAILLAGRVKITDVILCIDCFRAQTYPNKELVVVNNAPNQFSASDLNIMAEENVFLVDTPVEFSAGMARNYGISATNGQILAQFDPDYWHAPDRLQSQVAAMAKEGVHICALSSTLSYSFVSGRARIQTNNTGAILNTMVFTRPVNIDYPDTDTCEERELFKRMVSTGLKSIAIDSPELCCKLHLAKDTTGIEINDCGLSKSQLKLVKSIHASLQTSRKPQSH